LKGQFVVDRSHQRLAFAPGADDFALFAVLSYSAFDFRGELLCVVIQVTSKQNASDMEIGAKLHTTCAG
jgi:hypothetical protein